MQSRPCGVNVMRAKGLEKICISPFVILSGFARVAARFNATIMPVGAIGADEAFEMLLDSDELLRLPYWGERAAETARRTPVALAGECRGRPAQRRRALPQAQRLRALPQARQLLRAIRQPKRLRVPRAGARPPRRAALSRRLRALSAARAAREHGRGPPMHADNR